MTNSTVKPKIIFTKQPAYGGIVNGFFGVGIRMSIGGPGGREPIGAVDGVLTGCAGVVPVGWAGVESGAGPEADEGVSGGLESSLMGPRREDIVHRSLSNVHWEFWQ
jgi:hypothetical protein